METPTSRSGRDARARRFAALGDRPEDDPSERLRHRLLVGMGLFLSAGAAAWSALAFAVGAHLAAAIPLAYLGLTALNLVGFAVAKRFEVASFVQISASVVLPFVFQWALGGMQASGGAMLWALVAVVGSLTFARPGAMTRWLALYVVLAITSAFVDGWARSRFGRELRPDVLVAFLTGNIVFISIIVVALVAYFIRRRDETRRALEQAEARIVDLQRDVADAQMLGQYTLVEKIGAGGMGAVYRASHAMLRRPTAIKLVKPEITGEATLARFEREVQLTATLTHPNVITVYDYGRTDGGTFYYVMEYVEGADLGVVVGTTGPFRTGRAVHVLAQIASALTEAHRQGLVHRDVKPANVLLTYTYAPDVVKVVDFGLVKDVSGLEPQLSLADAGMIVSGTPAYMSPESITTPAAADMRSDVYSLGCLAYFLVAGVQVFSADTAMEMWAHHLRTVPIAPSTRTGREVAKPLEELIRACLAKAPDERPAMADVAAMLERWRTEPWAAWDAREAEAWWQANRGALVAARRAGRGDGLEVATTVARAVAHTTVPAKKGRAAA
jgi:tRNA A-37 threonylcarbamoyl transferase component Bud32